MRVDLTQNGVVPSKPLAPAPTGANQLQPKTLTTVQANKNSIPVGLYGPNPAWLNKKSRGDDKTVALSFIRFLSTQIAETVIPHHPVLGKTVVKGIWLGLDSLSYRAELRAAPDNRLVNSLKGLGLAADLVEAIAVAFNVHGIDPWATSVHFGLDQAQKGLTGRAAFDPADIQKWAIQLQGDGVSTELIDILRSMADK
jgi:hypothetical protein